MSAIAVPLGVRRSVLDELDALSSNPVLLRPGNRHRDGLSILARPTLLAGSRRSWSAIGVAVVVATMLLTTGATRPLASAGGSAEAGSAGPFGGTLVSVSPPGGGESTAPSSGCDGWRDVSPSKAYLMDVLALGPDHAWTAGAELNRMGPRKPIVEMWDGSRWTRSLGRVVGPDNGFVSIAGTGAGDLWAVGFHSVGRNDFHVLAEHWNGNAWAVDSPPAKSGAQMLVGADAVSAHDLWTVGYRVGREGRKKPIVWHHTGAGWTAHHPFVPAATSAALTSVAASASDDIWAVGWATQGDVTVPLLEHWNGRAWARSRLSDVQSRDAVLADVAIQSPSQAWGVGYRLVGSQLRSLITRWDGQEWRTVAGPAASGPITLLTGVAVSGPGAIWIVGTRYEDASHSFHALAARFDGNGWLLQPDAPPYTFLRKVSGPLETYGWAVASSRAGSARVRACAASALPGASTSAIGDTRADEELVEESDLQPGLAPPAVPTVGAARALVGVRARDVAVEAGVDDFAWSHGAVTTDFDKNGWPDLFISRHGGPGRLLMNHSGQFSEPMAGAFPLVDRHGCAAGDLDGSGKPDLYCARGAVRGTGVKTNELWLDPGMGQLVDGAVNAAVADPVGRGRSAAILDGDGDGHPDLYVGNSPHRYDGLPSPSRYFRNNGDGTFVPSPEAGLDNSLGAWCATAADIDGDGDPDLLLCAHDESSTSQPSIHVFRNASGRFRDVTNALGIRSMGEHDAEFVDLDRDGKLDLVQVGVDRLRVSLQRGGQFVSVYERSIRVGHTVASGDVNGDRYPDLYVQLGMGDFNEPDLLLINDGTGRSFTAAAIPETTQGSAEDAIAIDYDRNGLTDFLVLNGWTKPGPVQLIAFTKTH